MSASQVRSPEELRWGLRQLQDMQAAGRQAAQGVFDEDWEQFELVDKRRTQGKGGQVTWSLRVPAGRLLCRPSLRATAWLAKKPVLQARPAEIEMLPARLPICLCRSQTVVLFWGEREQQAPHRPLPRQPQRPRPALPTAIIYGMANAERFR